MICVSILSLMAWGDPQINSFNLPESIEQWLSKQCDSNPGINLTLPHLQKLFLCALFTRKISEAACCSPTSPEHQRWFLITLFVARDEALSGRAGAAVRFPQGIAPSPWGCLWARLSLPPGLWDWQLGKCLPSKWQKCSGSGTNLRNNYKTSPSCSPEDFLRGAVMEINTLGIFLLLWELRGAEFN